MSPSFAFVTLVSSDAYLPGALAQAAALRDIHPSPAEPSQVDFQTVCLVTPETVDVSTIKKLRSVFDLVVGVEAIVQEDQKGLKLLGRLDLNTVLTKLHVFRLAQFEKIIFLDADVLPIRPLSHLFTLPYEFSAVPDVGWPDIFNSGVLVLAPGEQKFTELTDLLKSKGTWDGGDQGLLNEWRGDDWHRLSFIYNTTPTAAYTYAPAYERFGSRISAIHFIGPNKPWNSLPNRPPFYNRQEIPSSTSGQAYDYNSLLDRWFSVYDIHYRSHPSLPPQSFGYQRYESAWNAPPPPSVNQVPARSALDLKDLREWAIKGTNAYSEESESNYHTLPLEGRVDLMRPKAINQEYTPDNVATHVQMTSTTEPADLPVTPVAGEKMLSSDIPLQWHTLPTPGPDEVPPSPRPRTISLPETPIPRARMSSVMSPESASAPEPSQEREVIIAETKEVRRTQTGISATASQDENKRAYSPPMLVWNPAIEPPPQNVPTTSAFPTDTFYPNVWDQVLPQRSEVKTERSPAQELTSLFNPLPPPEIPETLVRQGHYRQVTGEDEVGKTPSPDRGKVKPVFPWEEKPRQAPGRVFPAADSAEAATFLSPGSQTSPEMPTTPERKPAQASVLSPLPGFPSSLTYVNAWDTVPSIQRHASRLVRSPVAQPLAPAFEDRSWKRSKTKSREENAEADSRDGDIEDEGEESIEEMLPVISASPRSGRSLRSDAQTVSDKKREYRDFGVQTDDVEMKDEAVQVPPEQTTKAGKSYVRERRPTMSSNRHWSPANGSTSQPSITTYDASERVPEMSLATSAFGSNAKERLAERKASTDKLGTPKAASHVTAHSPISIARQTSSESSLGSPASSAGPLSPPDNQPTSPPLKRGRRVWDPARGVELFKRGSEEVLARFLRMGSWEDENR